MALRADLDALPVAEATGLPFASTATTEWNGAHVGMMHACGHDAHVAILMGVADGLAGMQAEPPGTVKSIFQPAERGAPEGETGGAQRMLAEGAFDDPRPEAVFGLHVMSGAPTGEIGHRAGPILASCDTFDVTVTGRQTHGALPWERGGPDRAGRADHPRASDDPEPAGRRDARALVLTAGTIKAGTRHNIVPEKARMSGTLRTHGEDMRTLIKDRMQATASGIAQSGGGSAEVSFRPGGYAATVNDPALTARMVSVLEAIPGATVKETPKRRPSEDFSFYAQQGPGLFLFVGAAAPGEDMAKAAPPIGMRALPALTLATWRWSRVEQPREGMH